MIRDTWIVARKEWLEIFDQLLRFKRGGWSILLIIGFLGVDLAVADGNRVAHLAAHVLLLAPAHDEHDVDTDRRCDRRRA